jgi:hypothetical protein
MRAMARWQVFVVMTRRAFHRDGALALGPALDKLRMQCVRFF